MNKAALQTTLIALTALGTFSACPAEIVNPAPLLTSTPIGVVALAWDTGKRSVETDSSGTVSFAPLSYSDIDDVTAGVRYLTATFRVTNLTARPLERLSLRAISTAGSLGGTALRDLRAFPDEQNPDGSPITTASVAQSVRPLHGMKPTDNAPQPDGSASDFQGYLPTESASLKAQTLERKLLEAGDTVLDYGFTVRGEALPSSGGTGMVSLAVRLPRRFAAAPKVFKFQVGLLVTTDSAPRVTRALLESTGAAQARAAMLGADTPLMLIGEPSDATGNVLRVANLRVGTETNLLP